MKDLFERWINRKVYINLGGLKVSVVIVDIKRSYGKYRFKVSPEAGTGEIWVESFLEIENVVDIMDKDMYCYHYEYLPFVESDLKEKCKYCIENEKLKLRQ